jgi:hypothetical protein
MKVLNIKFHGNPSSGSRADTCEQTDMTNLIGAFRNYENAPKNESTVFPRKWDSILGEKGQGAAWVLTILLFLMMWTLPAKPTLIIPFYDALAFHVCLCPSDFPTKILCAPIISFHVCYMSCSSQSSGYIFIIIKKKVKLLTLWRMRLT